MYTIYTDDCRKTKRGGDQETEIKTDDVPVSSNTFYNLPTPADTHLNFLPISSGHNHEQT